MRIKKVAIKNFRLLSDVSLVLETSETVIVGRNNSGKTSLSEVMRRLLDDGPVTFQLEDFSSASYRGFCAAAHARLAGQQEDEVRALLPAIELRLYCTYDPNAPELGPLAPFVVDLDPGVSDALIVLRYELKEGRLATLFEGLPDGSLDDASRTAFLVGLRERIPANFGLRIRAEDPNDPTNSRALQPAALRSLVRTGFINAQRGLDAETSRETDVLAKILEGLFVTASSPTADAADKVIAEALATVVQGLQTQIDGNFGNQLQNLMPTLNSFGYPGLGGQELQTETTLDIRKLLSNFTRVRYAGYGGVTLPESYNGLGVRNLIFILLRIVEFHKAFKAEPKTPGVHLVFIEEPEAHLHPQMQEVFIKQLGQIATQLAGAGEGAVPWSVQFVVSTHSSHIANAAGFESIRYFLGADVPGADAGIRQTKIKDLREGPGSTPAPDKQFLHQYLTLTRCDLFFADKAILVEGLSERVMLPVIIGKAEAADPAIKLSSQYLAIMEVGGAYAHLFFGLLDFLELHYLIITDLDSVEVPGGAACPVHLGTASSNACLRTWFNDNPHTLAGVMAKSDDQKTDGRGRIAYQVPEVGGGPCGRTFEDAFILANQGIFGLPGGTLEEQEVAARDLASRQKKSEFALKYAIQNTGWVAPRYLTDGIRWLAVDYVPPVDPALAIVAAAAAAPTPAVAVAAPEGVAVE
ncbi:ATP-dependent endonuclease [Mesorhizobium abyssinicae]|uniref:ATP-dependent endonuclease n=1 Tax=Mesorhizobium abyssinicae TaxID=1209958 RepID=UPI002A24E73C|nr:ATP-dependent endonuclease [Mesorhizobium abyssinicae]MDX8437124.1 ATP-dependent endonuclease [Mesorhizobium abyssinicae]